MSEKPGREEEELSSAAAEIAKAFVDARKSRRAILAYPGEAPHDLADAYRIQDAALSIWDRAVGGWKVGKINPPDDARLGANRLVGPVFGDSIFDFEGTPVAMPVFEQGFAAAEGEFMLRLAPRDERGLPDSNAAAMEWVDEIRIGIEIASSPYARINRDGPCVTISDHGNNHGLVLGAKVERSDWHRLDDIDVTVEVDGQTVGRATTASMLDGPFGAVRFLLDNLHRRGITPRAGWWISSGAITGVHDVSVGASVTARFAGLGAVSSTIAGAATPVA